MYTAITMFFMLGAGGVAINVEHVTYPNMTLSECLKFKKGWEKSATHYQGIYTATDCIPTKNLYSSKTIKS